VNVAVSVGVSCRTAPALPPIDGRTEETGREFVCEHCCECCCERCCESIPVAARNTDIQSVGSTREESGMPHVVLSEVAAAIDIQTGAVVSRVIFRDDRTEVTVFGFDAGEGLSEHQASRSAIVQIVKGRLELFADGEQLDAGPGFWLHMEPGTPHSLTAREPTVMLLTLIDAG
jgi:quercetin dioxygenase-like cupin family protein